MPHTNLLESDLAALVVIDVQEKMLSAIASDPSGGVLANITRLIEAAKILGCPVLHTEQYPQGLGPTVEPLLERLPDKPLIKTTCSAWRDDHFRTGLQETHREHIILVGLETHVCIQQTALDLLRVDYVPFVAIDAVGSRRQADKDAALARMARAGVELSTTEALIFELVERCDHPRFKDILKLVK